jgi:hypothetical protein
MIVGDWSITAKQIHVKLKKNIADFTGGVTFINGVQSVLEPGSMRIDSMKSAAATVQLGADKNGKQVLKNATATGGVIIKGKRSNQTQGTDGKAEIVIQDVIATAKSAEVPNGADKAILTGNVIVKIMNPGDPVPAALITGEKVEISFPDAEISVTAAPEGLSEIKVPAPPKEKQKSQRRQK